MLQKVNKELSYSQHVLYNYTANHVLYNFMCGLENQVDIQALAHAVELTRQGAVDSLRFAKGDLFQAFQVINYLFNVIFITVALSLNICYYISQFIGVRSLDAYP